MHPRIVEIHTATSIVSGTASDQFLHRRVNHELDGDDSDVVPFLKWAGGKRWLLPLARELRRLDFDRYFEPFLGSGAMFFGLAPHKATLSDANADLAEAFLAVKDDWEKVERSLREHHRKHSNEYYYQVRAAAPRTAHTRAARLIYLNRTCWNGLYRVNLRGTFNVPIGTKKSVLLESDDFERVARRLAAATIVAGDFEAQIDKAAPGDLVFADPPYTVRHQFNGFVKYNERLFSWDDQKRLFACLMRAKARDVKVVCTNADHSSIRELYDGHFHLTPVERYSAIAGSGGVRGNYAELLITG